MTILGETFDSL